MCDDNGDDDNENDSCNVIDNETNSRNNASNRTHSKSSVFCEVLRALAPQRAERGRPGGLRPALGVRYRTPEVTEVKLHRKVPARVRWKLPPKSTMTSEVSISGVQYFAPRGNYYY